MSYNTATLRDLMANQSIDEFSQDVMNKCTSSCLLSLKESTLLPTEQRCLRNCFIKSHQFNDYMQMEGAYQFRNFYQPKFNDLD